MLRIPQVRAAERFGAVHEGLRHPDHDGEFGRAPLHAHALKQLRIVDQRRPAVDPQRVVIARNDEQQPDARICDDVAQAVETVVAGTVRDRQRVLVKNFHEAHMVAARADIGAPVEILRAQAQERRAADEVARMPVERSQHLLDCQIVGGVEQATKRLFVGDRERRVDLVSAHRPAPSNIGHDMPGRTATAWRLC